MKSRCQTIASETWVFSVLLRAIVTIVVASSLNWSGRVFGESETAGKPSPAEDPVRWDIDSLAAVVHPMKHAMTGRMPLLLWNVPIPRGNALVQWRQSGKLRRAIDVLAERGIVPTVDQGWEWTREGAMAMAATLQEAGRPVHVLIPDAELVESTAYANCPVWVEGPDATREGKTRKWPCLVHYKPEETAKLLLKHLQPYKDAGIRLAWVWLDDESLPHPWNGCYEAQISTAQSRQQYPKGVLDNFASFRKFADPLKAEILMKASVPIKQMFPGVRMGNFDDRWSAADAKFGLDAIMPVQYANTIMLRGPFKGKTVTQAIADDFYFRALLKGFNEPSKTKIPGKLNIPYVSRYVPDFNEKPYLFGMSQHCYRELLRHLSFRGADSLYLYNLGYDPQSVTPRQSFESVEDARTIYDEMLGHRQFLEKGTSLCFADPTADGAVWSALRRGDQCLVRTFTLGKTTTVKIAPFDGISITLDASPAGATYLVTSSGATEKVDEEAGK